MSMAGWQRLTGRTVQKSAQNLVSGSFRGHHSLSVSVPSQTSLGALDPILFPPVAFPGEEMPKDSNNALISAPFMQLMAVPKRKVTPSRKGKRNGPKALKPVPIVAKCKVCGRIKLPHFYCCSGEAAVVES